MLGYQPWLVTYFCLFPSASGSWCAGFTIFSDLIFLVPDVILNLILRPTLSCQNLYCSKRIWTQAELYVVLANLVLFS